MRTAPHWLRTTNNPRFPYHRDDVVAVKGYIVRVSTSVDYGSRGPLYEGTIINGRFKGNVLDFYAADVTKVIGRYNPEGLDND